MKRITQSSAIGWTMVIGNAWAGGLQTTGSVELEAVTVTGTRDNTGRTSLSASQGVATAEQLENRPRLRTGELLEVVPGLIVSQHAGDGKANQYFLRGFNLDHGTDFRTTVGGMPVNMVTHGHGQGYTDLNFVIPELVESIHYEKGSYNAAEGDFATAGAANLTLYRELPQGIANVDIGENRYRRLVAADSFSLAGGTALLGLEAAMQDGPWVVPEDTHKLNALASYSWAVGDYRFSLTGLHYSNRWTSTDQIPLRAVQAGTLDRFGSLDDSSGGRTARSSLSLDVAQGSDTQGWRGTAYVVNYRLNLFSNFTYFLDNPVDGDQFEQADKRTYGGGSLHYQQAGSLFGHAMQHRVGSELRHDDIGNVGIYKTARRQRLATVRQDAVRETSIAAYYSNTLYWTPWLRSIAGLRVDHYAFKVDSDKAANSGRADDTQISPKLSLIAGPWRRTELFLNAGAGFHSNDARGTTTTVDLSGAAVDPVDPLVQARGAEIGVQTRLIPRVQTALTVWALKLDSELFYSGEEGTTSASRPSRREGIEFANYWTPAPGLIFDADVALSHSRFDDRDPDGVGRRIPSAIERTASVGVVMNDGHADRHGLFGGLRLRYFGSRPLVEDNRVRSSASTLVNLRAGYAFTPRVKLAVDVFNLFDREVSDIDYFYESQQKSETAPVEDIHFHPAEPRSVRASLIARF